MVVTEEDTKRLVKVIETIHDDIIAVSSVSKIENFKGLFKNLPLGVDEDGVRPGISLHNLAYRILSFMEKHPKKHIELSALVIEDVATSHYFWDGNKRTAFVFWRGHYCGPSGCYSNPTIRTLSVFL